MDLENIVYKIINGYYTINIDNIIYKIVYPNIEIKQRAHVVYLQTIEDNKYDTASWISENQIENLLYIYNIWNKNLEQNLQNLIKDLDKTKIELYKNFANSESRSFLKELIKKINTSINELYNKKHYFDYLTLEFYAQNIKNQYLISNMIYSIDNQKIFNYDTLEGINSIYLDKILVEIHANAISSSTIKQIARNELWKSFWTASKERIFTGSVKDWTDEQRSLINFSKMLDSIREHMECPSEEILSDDDALDGWIFYQNDKNEKEKKKQQISDKFALDKKRAGEVFLITNNKEETKEIYSLNDMQTNKDIHEMIDITQQKGKVKWTELPHVQRDIKNQIASQKQR